MRAPGRRRCMRFPTTKQCPTRGQPNVRSCAISETNLERHEQGLALNVRKTQVHAAGVAVGVTIPNDMLDLRGYAIDEAVRELRDAGVIPLRRKVSMQSYLRTIRAASVPLHKAHREAGLLIAKPGHSSPERTSFASAAFHHRPPKTQTHLHLHPRNPRGLAHPHNQWRR